jgi:protein-S-isoprenylcysteine O-methyltransferase Ste14
MLSADGIAATFKSRWDLLALNVVFFVSFLVFIPFKRKVSWRSHGIFAAFIVALFAEMYGLPLTMFLFSGITAPQNPTSDFITLSMFGGTFSVPELYLYGSAVIAIGLLKIVLGRKKIYGQGGGSLVTSGVYGFSRHPQYLGLLLVSIGWLVCWPTPVTILMFPTLVYIYYRLSKEEESELGRMFGKNYRSYAKAVPMFI